MLSLGNHGQENHEEADQYPGEDNQMMNGVPRMSCVEEMVVPLTSSQPERVKYGPKVKDNKQEPGQRSSDHVRKKHPL